MLFRGQFCLSCYVLYRHVLLFPLLTAGDILLPVFFIVRICSSTGAVLSRVLTVGATLFSMAAGHEINFFGKEPSGS